MDPTEKTLGTLFKVQVTKPAPLVKWQLDGGDASIKAWDLINIAFGMLTDLYKRQPGSSYKNPTIYQDGGCLPSSETNGKYGEDFTQNMSPTSSIQ